MADSSGSVTPYNLGSLCTNCSRMFQGPQLVHIPSVLISSSVISLIKPEWCHVCSVIRSRHGRFVERASRRGETLDLREIEYIFMSEDINDPKRRPLRLRLYLNYASDQVVGAEFAVIPADFTQRLHLTRRLSPSTESQISIDFLKSKFKICQESHPICRQRSDLRHGWRPSRLLEIRGTDYHTVYLRNRDEITSRPYFTLSHCWGNLKPIQLTTETEASLRAGISINSLPKTFRDAIFITSKFSVPYLWVDSICIFQDDLKDWHREATAMCDVYSYALCNIAATGASDGSVGLFFERELAACCPFWVRTNWLLRSSGTENLPHPAGIYELFLTDQLTLDLECGPLNQRAWVMQERFLSTRVMHFSASQLFWECLENTSSDVFPNTIPLWAQPKWYYDSQSLKRVFFQTQRDDQWQERLYNSWQVYVKAYSICGLSKESDKLVAINGIGQLLSKSTGDRLIGGLWQGRLIQELCWSRDSDIIGEKNTYEVFYPQRWRAPTWSWASTNVEMHPGTMRHHVSCPNLQNKVTIESVDFDEFSSGQLKHASLTLRGKLLYATFVIRGPPFKLEHASEMICGSSSITGHIHDMGSFALTLDNPATRLPYREDLVCIALFACRCTDPSNQYSNPTRYLEALALRPHNARKDQYERVGIASMPDSSYDFYIANETNTEVSLVIV